MCSIEAKPNLFEALRHYQSEDDHSFLEDKGFISNIRHHVASLPIKPIPIKDKRISAKAGNAYCPFGDCDVCVPAPKYHK
jgi:hypothetical protein